MASAHRAVGMQCMRTKLLLVAIPTVTAGFVVALRSVVTKPSKWLTG